MFKWLENLIKNAIISALDERPDLFKNTLGHFVLSKEHPNVMEIDVGYMPKAKAEQHLAKMIDSLKDLRDEGYRFILMAKNRN